MSHLRMCHVTRMNELCHTGGGLGIAEPMHQHDASHTRVMSRICVSHVTLTNAPCHTYARATSHVWMSHVTRMDESCHTGGGLEMAESMDQHDAGHASITNRCHHAPLPPLRRRLPRVTHTSIPPPHAPTSASAPTQYFCISDSRAYATLFTQLFAILCTGVFAYTAGLQ